MKQALTAVSIGLMFGCSLLVAEPTSLVSIDSISIMQNSKEGKEITAQIQKDVEKFQHQVKTAQKTLADMQEDLNKKAQVLSQEALQEKTEALAKQKKDSERDLADKEEALRTSVQKKQIALREKQLKIAHEVSEKEKWGMVVDKNTPGVLFVSNAIDKTDTVLKAVDAKYLAKSLTTKATTSPTLKTVTKDTKTLETKKDIKVA
jgi:outer membrane protein